MTGQSAGIGQRVCQSPKRALNTFFFDKDFSTLQCFINKDFDFLWLKPGAKPVSDGFLKVCLGLVAIPNIA